MNSENKKKVEISHFANRDLADIWEYISLYDEETADVFISDIQERMQGLEEFPFMGATQEIFEENERFLVFKKYNIYYRIEEYRIFIRRILYGKQEISKYL